LQLWQDVAKALTDRKLTIQNDLSERLNPMGGPTLAEWLVGFRAAVDRYNDPNRRMVRILKHIRVRRADFERWFRKTSEPRRGPKSGTTGYVEADRKAFRRISRLMKEGKARSPHGAALMIADELSGGGNPQNKAKRVSARYRKEHGGTDR
jgi:hypothetical protein